MAPDDLEKLVNSRCFNPYTNTKTSLLFFDKNLAKRADDILFVKVENDGFDLGAQRREISENDLPAALKLLQNFQQTGRSAKKSTIALTVSRKRLLESRDVNLTGQHYREAIAVHSKWPMVKLGEMQCFF
jgi:type I restriction enzyme M protein